MPPMAPLARHRRQCAFGSDGLSVGFLRIGDIGGWVGKGLIGFKSTLLVLVTCLPNRIVPTVIPADAGLVVDHCPGSVARAKSFAGDTVAIESDEEGSKIAVTDFPFSEEAASSGSYSVIGGSLEFDSFDVGHRKGLLATVLEDNHDCIFVRRRRGRGRQGSGNCEYQYSKQRYHIFSVVHKSLLKSPAIA